MQPVGRQQRGRLQHGGGVDLHRDAVDRQAAPAPAGDQAGALDARSGRHQRRSRIDLHARSPQHQRRGIEVGGGRMQRQHLAGLRLLAGRQPDGERADADLLARGTGTIGQDLAHRRDQAQRVRRGRGVDAGGQQPARAARRAGHDRMQLDRLAQGDVGRAAPALAQHGDRAAGRIGIDHHRLAEHAQRVGGALAHPADQRGSHLDAAQHLGAGGIGRILQHHPLAEPDLGAVAPAVGALALDPRGAVVPAHPVDDDAAEARHRAHALRQQHRAAGAVAADAAAATAAQQPRAQSDQTQTGRPAEQPPAFGLEFSGAVALDPRRRRHRHPPCR